MKTMQRTGNLLYNYEYLCFLTLTFVVGLVWSNESRSYAGGNVVTRRVSDARLVRDEDPD
jgi:hypothetical protein